jgi:hypothetical protein
MDSKEKLYSLIIDFIHNRIYINQFCEMFSDTYNLEIDYDSLTIIENQLLGELSRIAYGYTDNEDEIKNCPQYYFTDKQVVEKVNEVSEKLEQCRDFDE